MIIADQRFKWGSPDSNINWSDKLRRGWIPVDIGRRDPVVRWMRIGTGVLQEPFVKDSISRFRAINGVAEFESLYSLVSEGTLDLPLVAPAGIIVNMTRCGFTLVLNALKAAEGVGGPGEADPVDGLLGLGVAGSRLWTRTCLDLLPRVITLFASYQGELQRRVIVKCGVWGAFGLSLFHRIWPEVPCLILIRDPVEVLVSNWLRPPGWIQDTYLKSGICPFGIRVASGAVRSALPQRRERGRNQSRGQTVRSRIHRGTHELHALPTGQLRVAEEAGSILKRFRPSHGMGLGGALIAATAIKFELLLWTRNRKHYPDLRIRFFEPRPVTTGTD